MLYFSGSALNLRATNAVIGDHGTINYYIRCNKEEENTRR